MTKNGKCDIIQTLKERNKKLIRKSDKYLADKDSENSKKFLTMSSKYDIIHTVRNEANNKVSKVLKKKIEKT